MMAVFKERSLKKKKSERGWRRKEKNKKEGKRSFFLVAAGGGVCTCLHLPRSGLMTQPIPVPVLGVNGANYDGSEMHSRNAFKTVI